ncbi:tyrosine-type recombinase/integrase [Novosphingobium resinovorum]|uniref:tyrosine-type recombinase/integrase n=1 Tax=Novosphingobium resinovorum TaxID=158500 RepID=UPI002ED47AE7
MENQIVIDRAGRPVDVSGSVWRLNEPTGTITLNFDLLHISDGSILDAFRNYIVFKIRTKSPAHVHNCFDACRLLLDTVAAQDAAEYNTVLSYRAFSEALAVLGKAGKWRLHDGRHFYRWARRQRFEPFCPKVEKRMHSIVLGGNEKGHAVRSQDPDKGPIPTPVIADLMASLKAMRLEGTMPVKEQAAIVLAFATGSNSGQYASMRDEDITPLVVDGVVTSYIVNIPRHKKGDALSRAQFRRRKLNTFLGGIVWELVALNSATPGYQDHASKPLFRRGAGPAPMRGNIEPEWNLHLTSMGFLQLLRRGVGRLQVKGINGKDLHATVRRFRYTHATRMKNNGASQEAIADALDHSDLQHVSVYWDVGSDIVEHLDRALAMSLAPRAQAFAGIVKNEASAVRGNEKGSRRYLADPATRRVEPVGTCGSFSFCNITAPYACYTCVRFQAWSDGPHEEVLAQLLHGREKVIAHGVGRKVLRGGRLADSPYGCRHRRFMF